MRHPSLAALLAAATLLPGPTPLAAQAPPSPIRSDPTGFHFAGQLQGAGITTEDDDEVESGPGLALALGWGVNRTLTLYVEAAGANVAMAGFDDTYTLAHVDLGARMHFGQSTSSARPYLAVAYSGRAAVMDVLGHDLTMSGTGLTFGGGVLLFASRRAAVDLGVRWTVSTFTEVEYRGDRESLDLEATSARLNVGVAWWAGR